MIAYIPLSVTADLGVAMRRVRAKRISKIRKLCPSLFQTIHTNTNSSKNNNKDHGKDDAMEGDEGTMASQKSVETQWPWRVQSGKDYKVYGRFGEIRDGRRGKGEGRQQKGEKRRERREG